MSTWKLVTCLYTVEKGKRLEEKLINNRLSNTLSVLVVAQAGWGLKMLLIHRWLPWWQEVGGCPLFDPKSGGFLLTADKARELNF